MTPDSFAFIAGVVKSRSGLMLTPDKGYMLETRLGPLLKQHALASLDALAARLRENLRLRKAQSRAIRDAAPPDDAALPKPGGER